MYAVVKTGGKQYRVSPGDKLRVESLDVGEGESIDLDQVLMVGDGADVTLGSPLVSGAVVSAKVLSHGRGKKIDIIKFRRRKHYRRQMGHRQNFTELEITSVNGVTADSSGVSGGNTTSSASDTGSDSSAGVAAATATVTMTAAAATLKFLDAPNGDPDDLKKILGIGSVLEEKLNELGVYHYSQIGEFSDDDIANVNTHLNFPGRIERDEWIVQAQDLMQGGEGRKLKYLDGPEGDADDLKLISGVGPVLEEKLNELGIYHFWQIAKLNKRTSNWLTMRWPSRVV